MLIEGNNNTIEFGKNVWIGLGCKMLKGTIIPNNTIIGAGSLVSGTFLEENVILAGNQLEKKQAKSQKI